MAAWIWNYPVVVSNMTVHSETVKDIIDKRLTTCKIKWWAFLPLAFANSTVDDATSTEVKGTQVESLSQQTSQLGFAPYLLSIRTEKNPTCLKKHITKLLSTHEYHCDAIALLMACYICRCAFPSVTIITEAIHKHQNMFLQLNLFSFVKARMTMILSLAVLKTSAGLVF